MPNSPYTLHTPEFVLRLVVDVEGGEIRLVI